MPIQQNPPPPVLLFSDFAGWVAFNDDKARASQKIGNYEIKLTTVIITQPAKLQEKVMWRSIFLSIWHRILNANSTKTPFSSVTAILLAGYILFSIYRHSKYQKK